MKITLSLALMVLLAGCGKTTEFRVDNPSKSAMSCTMDLGSGKQEFTTSESFSKTSDTQTYIYMWCQKTTSGDLSTITATMLVNGQAKSTQTTQANLGAVVVGGSPGSL